MAERIANFDDWKDLFYKWQTDIGFDPALVKDYKFAAIYDDGTGPTIEFGDFKGRKKFAKVLDVPTQDMRDSLLHLIFYQGDTEFGSSEQQRKLIDTAPTDYDRQCLLARHARGATAWLADVPCADQQLRRFGQVGSAKAARTPRL